MKIWIASLVAAVCWTAYLVGDHKALELIAALSFTLAWALTVIRQGNREIEAIVREAVEDKGKDRLPLRSAWWWRRPSGGA